MKINLTMIISKFRNLNISNKNLINLYVFSLIKITLKIIFNYYCLNDYQNE